MTLFPPTEIPKLARSIAKVYGTVRRTAEDFRSQIMDDEDLRAPLDEVRSAYNDARWQVTKVQQDAREELRKAEREARVAVSSTTASPQIASGDPADHHDEADHHDDVAADDDDDDDGDGLHGQPLGYEGSPLPAEEEDPRFAADDADDTDDDADPFYEGEDAAAHGEDADPFSAPIDEASPSGEASKRPRIPGPPPVGGGSSRAV